MSQPLSPVAQAAANTTRANPRRFMASSVPHNPPVPAARSSE